MKRFAALGIVICVAICLSTGAFAQAGKFSVQFDDTPLSRALDAFKRFDPNFQFALAPELADTRVTVSLDGVTVDEAMAIVLGQAGLMSVKDAGVYQIRQKPDAKGPRVDRPTLRLAPPVFINRASAPGAAAAGGAAPAAGAAPGAAGEAAKPPLRLIIVRFADPGDMAFLFGGSIAETSGGSGGSGGGGGGGGYGSSGGSGGGNSSSGGSSRGSSGGSSRGSSGGSSRGSSGGSY